MGLYNTLNIGVSGLNAFGDAIGVIGSNIANVNTMGYKAKNVIFSDVLSQIVNVNGANIATLIGNGVSVGSVSTDTSQGNIQNTNSATDMAINGNGLFVLTDANGSQSYTRVGNFILDKSKNLISNQGLSVQGWALDNTGSLTGGLSNINFSGLTAQAQATSKVDLSISLDASAAVPANPTFALTTATPPTVDPTTYNYKSELSLHDSLGANHAVSIYFTKTADNAWSWNAVADGADIAGGTAGEPQIIGGGSLTFDTSGALDVEVSPQQTFTWAGGAAPGKIDFNFGTAITTDATSTSPGTGTDGTVQLAGSFATQSIVADGFAAGNLANLETDSQGKIFGVFTNGERRALYQVALANFPNSSALNQAGDNLLVQSIASGAPTIGQPGSGSLGTISPFGLEQSNVDLASEFVKMIQIQRGYEANSKSIQTTDQMLSTLMQIKR